MSGHGRERIAKRCEHFSKAMFCASNILLTAAWSDPSIMCEYISSPGPPPLPCHPLPPLHRHIHTHPHTHSINTHISYQLKTPTTPSHPHPPPPSSSFSSSIEVNYQNCVWKWMKGDLLSLSPSLLSLSLPRFLSLSPFLLWHLSFFFFFLTCHRFWARW